MNATPAVQVTSLTHRYGARIALRDVSFDVSPAEIFAFLGPNGGGKTTLFRVLSTLVPPQCGEATVFGHSVQGQRFTVRRLIGVVFQSPSVDKKLTVDENMAAQASLYGLYGPAFRKRRDEVLEQLGILDRRADILETLSGGLRRRVDLAKALIHRPRLLLMDEPSTGLDPAARSDLWRYLRHLREQFRTTIVLTTHLLEEADRADQIAILHAGQIVAAGEPGTLRAAIGGNSITVETDQPETVCHRLNDRGDCHATVVDGDVRVSGCDGIGWAAQLADEFAEQIRSVKFGRPTLEDVFIQKTGHRFWQENAAAETSKRSARQR